MITEPIIINETLKLWPNCFLSVRRGLDFIELVSSEGTVIVEGFHLEHLLRLILHGSLRKLSSNQRLCLGGCVEAVSLAHYRRAVQNHRLSFPDSCPLPAGWLCVEAEGFGDYHPVESLQIIGINANRYVLGFAQASYEVVPRDGEGDQLRMFLMEDFGVNVGHLSAWDVEGFLKWPPSKRLHVAAIEEVPHRPDSWDGMTTIVDRRGELEQRSFIKRLPEPVKPVMMIEL